MFSFVLRLLLIGMFLSFPMPATAQQTDDPSEGARFRWGPIRFTPTLEITNFGRDSNVFNEAENPKDDFTTAIGPAVQIWMRPFRSRLNVTTGGQYLFFNKYEDQRAWNTRNELRWEVPLARLTPFVGGTYVNSRDRQGFEIDSRARRLDRGFTGGTGLRISGKTSFVLSHRRSDIEYDDRETFFGARLARELNRVEEASTLQFRYALTPLTTFVADTEVGRDRFDSANVRDSDSVRVMSGFELKPAALISGSVFVGFRRFNPVSDALADYSGVVAAVKAMYLRSSTRYDVQVDRDIQYSFRATNPYYALLNTGLKVTQRVTQRWELVAQGSIQRLAYRALAGAANGPLATGTPREQDRVDRGSEVGGGIGFRMNESVRLGFDVRHGTRRSDDTGRRFEGTRLFGSITYGIQQ